MRICYHIQAMIKLDNIRTVRGAATGLVLALVLCGCVTPGQLGGRGREEAWLAYFGADELHRQCDAGAADRFRLVYQRQGQEDFRIIDVVGDGAGGAAMDYHNINSSLIDSADPPLSGDHGNSLALGSRGLGMMLAWMDWMNMFSPDPGYIQPPANPLSWLITGCLDGPWFFNIFVLPPDDEQGVRVNFPPPFSRERK